MLVTDSDRRFWLNRFSDYELAQIAVALFDCSVSEDQFKVCRERLLGPL